MLELFSNPVEVKCVKKTTTWNSNSNSDNKSETKLRFWKRKLYLTGKRIFLISKINFSIRRHAKIEKERNKYISKFICSLLP